MNSDLERAMRSFTREVDEEAIRQIEMGLPPWDAVEKARNIVSQRRANRASETAYRNIIVGHGK